MSTGDQRPGGTAAIGSAPAGAATVTARAPGKINLSLQVGSRRPDGYHQLATLFHAVHLDDVVTATAVVDGSVTVEVTDEHGAEAAGVPADETNLAVRAALLLRREVGGRHRGAHLAVRKSIPVAGGMAGGSADAAAALVACNELWGTGLGPDRLAGLAARLGSDVPFALIGGSAVGTGRGEQIEPLAAVPHPVHWVLARSASGLSTPAVYAVLDRQRGRRAVPDPRVDPRIVTALERGLVGSLGLLVANDLEAAVLELRPSLGTTLAAGRQAGARAAFVSGSGPTLAFLVDPSRAARLARALSRQPGVDGARHVTGPAPGAAVVG